MDFYTRAGRAVCYSPDGEHLYAWNGKPVGYLSSGRVYSFGGKVLGWFHDGWLYDRSNRPAMFSREATGGPMRPVRQIPNVKSLRQVRPVKAVKHVAPVRPVRKVAWSPLSDLSYFGQ